MAVRAHTQITVTKQAGQGCPSSDWGGGEKQGLDFSLAVSVSNSNTHLHAISERTSTSISPQGLLLVTWLTSQQASSPKNSRSKQTWAQFCLGPVFFFL